MKLSFKKVFTGLGKYLALTLVVLLLIFSVVGLWAWFWLLPGMISERLVPEYAAKYGFDNLRFNIRRIGFDGTDIENIRVIGRDSGKLGIDSLRLDYQVKFPGSNQEVLEVTQITVNDLDMTLTLRNGKLFIGGVDLERIAGSFKSEAKDKTLKISPDKSVSWVKLNSVILRRANFNLEINDKLYQLPVEAELKVLEPDWSVLELKLKGFFRGEPVRLTVLYNGNTKRVKIGSDLEGDLRNFRDIIKLPLEGGIDNRIVFDIDFLTDEITGSGKITTKLNEISGEWPVRTAGESVIEQELKVKYSLTTKLLHAITTGQMKIDRILANKDLISISPQSPVNFKAVFSASPSDFSLDEVTGYLEDVKIKAYDFDINAPLLRFAKLDNGQFLVSGNKLTATGINGKLKVEDMSLSLPLNADQDRPGTLLAEKIKFDKFELGMAKSYFYRDAKNVFQLKGNFLCSLFSGVKVDFHGDMVPRIGRSPDLHLSFNMPGVAIKSFDVGQFVPDFAGAKADGFLMAGGAMSYENGKMATGGHIFLQDGSFDMPEKSLSCKGILLDLRVTDWFTLNTPSSQKLAIKSIESQKIKISNVEINFSLDSKELMLLESLGFNWCGGLVYMRPMRLRSNQEKFSTVLYCENIELAQMLNEIGLVDAVGSGSIYGKIPVEFNKDGIFFEKSYLYSKPGAENNIRMEDPTAVVGAVAAQSQLEFASEALKNFNYNWVKITLDSSGEDMLMSFQFDGQPAGPLPFVFDENSGQLVRNDFAKANFQGIQLNINTKIQLNRILKFNQFIKKMTGQ